MKYIDSIWQGEGWYRMGWSDGGQDWTSDGPVWFGTKADLEDCYESGEKHETETHLLWCEYMGSGDDPHDMDGVISATEAAAILGVSRMRVNQLLNEGKLDGRKVGNAWQVYRYSLDARMGNAR